jgi:hypothetical protein
MLSFRRGRARSDEGDRGPFRYDMHDGNRPRLLAITSAGAANRDAGVVRPLSQPLRAEGAIAVLRGNLVPLGDPQDLRRLPTCYSMRALPWCLRTTPTCWRVSKTPISR